MKHLARTTVITAAAAGALLAPSALPAMAAPAPASPELAWVNDNVVLSHDRTEATVLGKYRCSGGRTDTHLWVSVKQGPDITADQTSSEFADAWYDTNFRYETDDAGLTVDCDGKWHATRITVKPEFGTLAPGSAYIQWCMFDSQLAYAGTGQFGTVRAGA